MVGAMIFVFAACVLFVLVVPPLVGLFEGFFLRDGPRGVGFWALARLVEGRCHTRWGGRRSPIVVFPLPKGTGRARATRQPGRRGWIVETRAYQVSTFGFAGRICSPPAPPARWRAPGLHPLDIFPEEDEHLNGCSIETTDERLIRWLLRHVETRALISELRAAAKATQIEIILAGAVVIIRARASKDLPAGTAMEILGPPLVEALRSLSADLEDLSTALRDAGEAVDVSSTCVACGGERDRDPWVCPDCGLVQHRGCREWLSGCASAACERSADAAPGAVEISFMG